MSFKDIMELRRKKENQIQNEYNSLLTYKEKFMYIYKLLMISKGGYLQYTNNTIFNDNYLELLLSKIDESSMNDSLFIDFLKENVIDKIGNGHIYLYPTNYEVIGSGSDRQDSINETFTNDNVKVSFIDGTVVISIKSFSNKRVSLDKYIFDNLSKYLSENVVSDIVIDIRGNSGGSDTYFNYFRMFTDENYEYTLKYYDLFINKIFSDTWVPVGKGTDKHYNKYLLVDNSVFSTSEMFTDFCKQTGYATIIGEKTSGEGKGLTPLTLKIVDTPYTGKYSDERIIVKDMALRYTCEAPINEYGEIDYDNCYATSPDIKCASAGALDVCLELINKKRSNVR